MARSAAPPSPGNWARRPAPRTGQWSIPGLWVDREAGRLAARVKPELCNAYGVMHGGAMATLADGQCVAVRDYSGEAGDHTPTVTLSVDYLAPAPQGSWIRADVLLLKTTRSLIFTEATMLVDDEVIARSNAIYRNFTGKDAR